jgi:TolB-like protein
MNIATSAVFLSYASQDAEAARALVAALRAAGIEVWFDQAELAGGDAWDAKIRTQIAACALFIPLISTATQSRREGYFRLEWKLAAQRTHAMVDGTPFLLPVVIDDTRDADALVPPEFKAVQWTRLAGGVGAEKFSARVAKLLGATAAAVSAPLSEGPGSAPVPGAAAGVPPGASARRMPPRRLLIAGLALGGVALGGALLFWLRPSPVPALGGVASAPTPLTSSSVPKPATAASAATAKEGIRIVVLPFANLSGDAGQEYFSDGITEEILDRLALNRGLRVIGRTSSFALKGKNLGLPQIARELNVAMVIDGSVRRAGSRLRISARLFDAPTDTQLWSETFDRELTDIFAIQSEIAQKVAARLDRGDTQTAVPAPTANLAAYEAYTKGLQQLRRGNNFAEQAAGQFRQSTTLDPAFALAWAALADALVVSRESGLSRTPAQLDEITRALQRARQQRPELPEAQLAEARLLAVQGDHALAERRIAEAEALLGTDHGAVVAMRARLAALQADPVVSAERYRWAVDLDPLNAALLNRAGQNAGRAGRFPEADVYLARALALEPDNIVGPLQNLWQTRLSWRGPAAAEALARRLAIPPLHRRYMLARSWVFLGRLADARAAFTEVLPALGDSLSRESNIWSARGWLEVHLAGATPDLRELMDTIYAQASQRYDTGDRATNVLGTLIQIDIIRGRADLARKRIKEWQPNSGDGSQGSISSVFARKIALFAQLGDTEAALDSLDVALEKSRTHFLLSGYALAADPLLAPLRGNPRFEAICREQEARVASLPDPTDP